MIAMFAKKVLEKYPTHNRGLTRTLAARGMEDPRNFQELLTKSVGPVHFS
jgi:hypothetical protein